MKIIWQKLKELKNKFNKNSIMIKNLVVFGARMILIIFYIHIQKSLINELEVYGCFCMLNVLLDICFSKV